MVMRALYVVGAVYHNIKGKRRKKEQILKLWKVFSYGRNDCIGDDLVKEDTHVLVESKFPALPRKSAIASRVHVDKLNTLLSQTNF